MENEINLPKQLSQYVFRGILSTVGASIYVLADIFFVAKSIGILGVAVMNLSMPLFNIMEGLGLLLGMGGGTLFTFYINKNKDKANQIYTQIFIIGIFLGIFFSCLGLFCPSKIAYLLGADQTTLQYTLDYVRIVLMFGPFFVFNNLLLSFIRNDHGTRIAMFAMVISSLANIFLDWILIIKLNLGMFGAGFATSLSPIISILITCLHFHTSNNHLNFVKPKISFSEIRKAFSIGLPSFLTEMSTGVGIFIYNWVFLSISGNDAVAAYGIAANVLLVALALFTGVAQGIQPIASHQYTKRTFNNICFSLRFGLIAAECLALICLAFVCLNPQLIINFFNASVDSTVGEMTMFGMKILLLSLVFSSLNVVFNIFFSAINNSYVSISLVILRGYILPLLIVITMAKIFRINGVWLSLTIIELITFIIELFVWSRIRKKLKNKFNA